MEEVHQARTWSHTAYFKGWFLTTPVSSARLQSEARTTGAVLRHA